MNKFVLSAQNIDIYDGEYDAQARTGATSAEQVAHAGAEGVILGHSEVGDSPDITKKKLQTIIARANGRKDFLNKLTILVGESWDEFHGSTSEKIAETVVAHLRSIIEGLPKEYAEHLVVGYEPKWGSRGSGRDDMPPPSPELITVVAKKIRTALSDMPETSKYDIPIIYGGRSTPERTEEILSGDSVEGLILGSACNSVKKTMDIAHSMEKARSGKRKVLHANFKAYNLPESYKEYIRQLSGLDDKFTVYLSPPHTDIRAVESAIRESR